MSWQCLMLAIFAIGQTTPLSHALPAIENAVFTNVDLLAEETEQAPAYEVLKHLHARSKRHHYNDVALGPNSDSLPDVAHHHKHKHIHHNHAHHHHHHAKKRSAHFDSEENSGDFFGFDAYRPPPRHGHGFHHGFPPHGLGFVGPHGGCSRHGHHRHEPPAPHYPQPQNPFKTPLAPFIDQYIPFFPQAETRPRPSNDNNTPAINNKNNQNNNQGNNNSPISPTPVIPAPTPAPTPVPAAVPTPAPTSVPTARAIPSPTAANASTDEDDGALAIDIRIGT